MCIAPARRGNGARAGLATTAMVTAMVTTMVTGQRWGVGRCENARHPRFKAFGVLPPMVTAMVTTMVSAEVSVCLCRKA